jgi:hypothetical protein
MVASLGHTFDQQLSPGHIDGLGDFAGELAGTYTVTFGDGRFDIVNDGMADPYCVGSYAVRDGRAWLRPERGFCYPIKLFDAAFAIDEGQLRFDPDTFRGEWPNMILFATRPLERVP